MDIMNEQQFATILDGMRLMIQTATEATRQATEATRQLADSSQRSGQPTTGGQLDQQWFCHDLQFLRQQTKRVS